MELVEYRGFNCKNLFIGLVQENQNYYIVYGKTGSPTISCTQNTHSIIYDTTQIGTFTINRQCEITIPFIVKDNTLINIQAIEDKTTYYTLINILEKIL